LSLREEDRRPFRAGVAGSVRRPAARRTAIFDQMTRQHIDFMLSKIPIGRFGAIDEVTSQFTRISDFANSFPSDFVSPITPALEAE
jgi:hypothetical protein